MPTTLCSFSAKASSLNSLKLRQRRGANAVIANCKRGAEQGDRREGGRGERKA